jgi:glyoxylase-like metal-dependent hydrolase (beta-lactamase superfamily II)
MAWSNHSYLIRRGTRGILIDCGDEILLDHVAATGVDAIDWVLVTHHHREQTWGLLNGQRHPGLAKAKIACHSAEKPLLTQPLSYRAIKPALGDPFTVHGASYVRPLPAPVRVDHTFSKMDSFIWQGITFWCIETVGNSPGHMAYYAIIDGQTCLFGGDVMTGTGKMPNWFDSECDYGFGAGLFALAASAQLLATFNADWLFPGQGDVISKPQAALASYSKQIRHLGNTTLRGWDVNRFAACDQDNVSQPTRIPFVWQVTPHLFKVRGPNFWPNFALILSENGDGLVVDCGLFDTTFLDQVLTGLKQEYGLKRVDACFVTHMHGDHILQAPHLRQAYRAKLWTMRGIETLFQAPLDYDYSAMIEAYGAKLPDNTPIEQVPIDRLIEPGELIQWNEYSLVVDWMPGQTQFHACLHGQIDGKHIAFTGDNIFGAPEDANQFGNEALVARNGAMLERGYLYAADYLHQISPDIIVGGHSWVIDRPQPLIQRMKQRSEEMRLALKAVSEYSDYRWMFDPYWVRILPYRCVLTKGQTTTVHLQASNLDGGQHQLRVTLICPAGITAKPDSYEFHLTETSHAETIPIELTCTLEKMEASPEVPALSNKHMGLIVVTLDGVPRGPLFDFLIITES